MLVGVVDVRRVAARRIADRPSSKSKMLAGDPGVGEGTTTATTLRPLPTKMTMYERKMDRTSLSYLWAPVHCQVNGCTLKEKFCDKSTDGCETVVGWPDQHYHILKY